MLINTTISLGELLDKISILIIKEKNIADTQKQYHIKNELDSLNKTLEDLILLVRERKKSSPEQSYTKKLLNDKLLSTEKVKEEIKELIESVENNSNKVHEAADVLYHLIVYLEANEIKIEDVIEELNKRKK